MKIVISRSEGYSTSRVYAQKAFIGKAYATQNALLQIEKGNLTVENDNWSKCDKMSGWLNGGSPAHWLQEMMGNEGTVSCDWLVHNTIKIWCICDINICHSGKF